MGTEHDRGDREAGQSRPVLGDPSARAAATDAIERLVAGLQDGLDRADADAYDRQFASDVLWGSPYGATVRGYAALNAVHRSLMAAGAAPPSRYEVVQSLSPLPGVAIVHVRRDDLAAGSGGGFSEMAMYVLVERDGQWWLAAGQNTPVAERRRHLGHGRFRRLSWLGRLLPAITGERLRNSKTIRDKAVPSMLATGAGPLAALPARHLRQNRS